MEEDVTYKIYIPHTCLQPKAGILIGRPTVADSTINFFVFAIVSKPICSKAVSDGFKSTHEDSHLGILGITSTTQAKTELIDTISSEFDEINSLWIAVEYVDSEVPKCMLFHAGRRPMELACDKTVVVVYNGEQILKSVYLMEDAYRHGGRVAHAATASNSELITHNLLYYQQTSQCTEEGTFELIDCLKRGRDPFRRFLNIVEKILLLMARGLLTVTSVFQKAVPIWPSRLCNTPAVVSQLNVRRNQFKEALSLHKGSPLKRHRSRNLIGLHVFDVLMGLVVMMWMLEGNNILCLSDMIREWADNVAASLQTLLQWLMGSPAGLKLNRQLDQLLGKFFLYHIYLWTGYLQILRPFQVTVLQVIATSGVFGLSIQLSLMRDLISMMTLHIYCFYVYAARLYCLQVYALASLWRLFRGKKWNVLRERIDSASFDIDQLFIGTLFFTALLFLLPTTALYYVVFTTLRLMVLGIQGCFYYVVNVINCLPVASIFTRLVCSDVVSDSFKVAFLPHIQGRPLYVTMQTQPASFGKIIRSLKQDDVEVIGDTWGTFLKKLCLGNLIYPWIESEKK